MKKEIKALYKKDPKLAKQVAKVLGYRIKVKAETESKVMKMGLDKLMASKTNQASLGADITAYLIEQKMPVAKIKKRLKEVSEQIFEGGMARLESLIKMVQKSLPKE